MIAFLDATVEAVIPPSVALLAVQGVGYQVNMSQLALSRLPEKGASVRVLTYMQVSENGIALYGFLTPEEKTLFERLISVSGVGPKVALAALSTFSPSQCVEAIANQDTAFISRIPGVGKKTAQRIILELKGTLDDMGANLFSEGPAPVSNAQALAAEALLSMGFTTAEIDLALKNSPADMSESQLIQHALKKLGGN
jgi:Holliday junction DNA helicase RuvA